MQRRLDFVTALTLSLLSTVLPGDALASSKNDIEGSREISTIRCGNTIDGISDQALGPKTLTIQSGLIISIAETQVEDSC
jgi:hypothetical protein